MRAECWSVGSLEGSGCDGGRGISVWITSVEVHPGLQRLSPYCLIKQAEGQGSSAGLLLPNSLS